MAFRTVFIWVCFIFCLGLTAGGILVLFKDKKSRKLPAFQYLQYYLVLIYTFGFYSIWSKIFFQIIYGSNSTLAENSIVSNFLVILGIPFLVVGKFMLIIWSMNLLKKKPDTIIKIGAFAIIFLIVLVYIAFIQFSILPNIRQIYAVFVISTCICIIGSFLFAEIEYLTKKQKLTFSLIIAFSGLIYILLFFTELNQSVYELVYVFLFFISNTSLVVYFIYVVKMPIETVEVLSPVSFDVFVEKYSITAREAEIAQHIYEGKTNREIADRLFVTVQTIKDHTHRIYQKTDVKSRAQLTSLMRTFLDK